MHRVSLILAALAAFVSTSSFAQGVTWAEYVSRQDF